MEDLIPWLVFGVPLLVAAGLAAWFLGRPVWQARRLEAAAAAGDPAARAAVERRKRVEAALQRALRGGDDPERRRLLAAGRPARATIVEVKQTGITLGEEPVQAHVVEVTLSIDGDGGARRVTILDVVGALHVGRLVAGASVPVRVDPMNAENVVVVWEAP
jgi:hypothetical protein